MTTPDASALAELERLATEFQATRTARPFNARRFLDAEAALKSALGLTGSTPERITALVAMASSGAADGAREALDHRDYCPESPNYLRVCNCGAHTAARSLPPSAPSDDRAQQPQDQTHAG